MAEVTESTTRYGEAEFEAVRQAVNADDRTDEWLAEEGIDTDEVYEMAVGLASSYGMPSVMSPLVLAGFEVGYRLAKGTGSAEG